MYFTFPLMSRPQTVLFTFRGFIFQNVTQIPQSTEQVSSDPSRDLAAVHDICWAYKSELQQLSQSQVNPYP